MCQTSFTLNSNNLFNCKIFKFPDNTAATVLIAHHIIADSWSVGLFCKQIIREYTSIINNSSIDTPAYSYIDFFNREQNYLSSPAFERDKAYWNSVFLQFQK